MMGGYGSGSHGYASRDTVEEHRSLNVNQLHREGCLQSGRSGGWHWTRDGEQVANINYSFCADVLRLTYRIRANGGDWQDIEEPVHIYWTPCRFGGQRPYFRCPGIRNGRACGRSVQKLYGASKYFLCRRCYDLSYASRREDRYDRAQRKANRLRRALGGTPSLFDMLPERPKGMWWQTYERKISQITRLDNTVNEKMIQLAARLTRGS